MRKETKEILKKILSNQELIMKHLKISTPSKSLQPVSKTGPVKTAKKGASKKAKK